MKKQLIKYRNGGYEVVIYKDGTKIRKKFSNKIVHVEHMDLKITDWCDANCAWCHENSTINGKVGNLSKTIKLLKNLPKGVEIAIGGGDPMSHPGLPNFLKKIKKMGFIANITINGRHFEKYRNKLNYYVRKKLLYGVGISYWNEFPKWDYENMVVHMIAGINSPELLDNVSAKKILLLGYKNFGRGIEIYSPKILKNINMWYKEVFHVVSNNNISFDNLAIEQINPSRMFVNKRDFFKRYMGEEGDFGMYLDAVEQEYALSSYSKKRYKWKNDINKMFKTIQNEK